MGKSILIVEDEQNIVDILSFNLSREGYDTLEAYDGPTGLQPVSYTHLDVYKRQVIALVQYVFGAVVIFHGVLDVQSSVSLMRQGAARWWLDLALSALTPALGALILINPFGTFAALVTLIGLVLIYDGLSDLWIIHRLSRMVRDLERDLNGDIIETRGRDLGEDVYKRQLRRGAGAEAEDPRGGSPGRSDHPGGLAVF